MAERAARHGEMRVDHVEWAAAPESESPPEAHRQIRRHGRQVRDGELAAEEHGDAHDADAVFDDVPRQTERARGEDRDVVTAAGQLGRHRGHDHASAAADRGILIVAEQNLHADPFRRLRGRFG